MGNDTRWHTFDTRTTRWLAIYLNDHLAGATGGVELIRRLASSQRNTSWGTELTRLAAEIEQDRDELLDIMRALGVRTSRSKQAAAWGAEKFGRLKLNGNLFARSPLASLLELEIMRVGVEGKALGWRTLRSIAERDGRLDDQHLDELHTRAQQQTRTLESLQERAVGMAFGEHQR